MYTLEKPFRQEFYKSRKNNENVPSFSSTLLDEIYHSIDGSALKTRKKLGVEQYEVIESSRRARLVEKWKEKEAIEKVVGKTRQKPDFDNRSLQDNDLMFISSSSSSSDSSGALSSSDTEFFGSKAMETKPKPVRTGAGLFRFDDNKNREKISKGGDDLIKSKSTALRIYASLKKVKQPISPGGRLTSLINSLLSNVNGKKSKGVDSKKVFEEVKSPSTCSSASSVSRSCLSKYSPKSREKMRNGAQRTVRFHPWSVIVDEDSRPCGHKCIYDEDTDKYGRPPLVSTALTELKLSKWEKKRIVEDGDVKGYNDKRSFFRKIHSREDEDKDGECLSDASSDLFELDHLALFGDNRFCKELPVYETTYIDTNRATTGGLIR